MSSAPPDGSELSPREESPEVDRLVRALRGEAISAERLAGVEARLGSLLDEPAPRARPRATRRIVLPLAAALLVAAATFAAPRLMRAPERPAAPAVPSSAPAPAPAPSAEVSADAPAPPPPVPSSSAIRGPTATASPKSPRPSEDELLARARGRLQASPAAALSSTEDHARLYPRGQLVEEREVIAIDALVRLGRRAEAEARARSFLATHPQSIFRTKVTQLVGRP